MDLSSTAQQSTRTSDAIAVLMRDLIDYAGLFPPASLSMAQSVRNFDNYSCGEYKWVLGRFIVTVARLGEFEKALAELPPSTSRGEQKWRLSALMCNDAAADVEMIRGFNDRMAKGNQCRRAVIESVEIKAGSGTEVAGFSAIIPAQLATYFEVPLSNCDECVAAISGCGRRAKIRTGGETPDKFPDAESVINFMRLCAVANVPFKATAGLHHPVRSAHRLTYHSESPVGVMHGFLNVFLAAAFLRAGMEPKLALQLLEEQSPQAFQFDQDGVHWRQHWLSDDEIAEARRAFALSFGSCSFTEPIDDLRQLHLL